MENSPKPESRETFIAPGNAGTSAVGENVSIKATDFPALKAFALEQKIDMIVVGPEDPLVEGIYDSFTGDASTQHIAIIGPTAKGAQLEGSKEFAKGFMERHGIPTARYKSITAANLDEGLAFLETLEAPYVLKADGLCAGKGVLILLHWKKPSGNWKKCWAVCLARPAPQLLSKNSSAV